MLTTPPMLQNDIEFKQLLDLYLERRPRRVLEVGVGEGGTLYHWLQHARDGATVVALDDKHVNADQYDEWTPDGVRLVALVGDSRELGSVLGAAAHGLYDWTFIDADHHDQAVRADWDNYSPMAAPGGVIVLHDVHPSDDPTIEVDALWRELEAVYETATYGVPGGPGIGVVWVAS